MKPKTTGILWLALLLLAGAYSFHMGIPNEFHSWLASHFPKIAVLRHVIALDMVFLSIIGLFMGWKNLEKAFYLWFLPLGYLFFSLFLAFAYTTEFGCHLFQIQKTGSLQFGSIFSGSSLLIFLSSFLGIFFLFGILWFLLGKIPRSWKEDPFYIPAVGGKAVDFAFPGFSEKGMLPRILRPMVAKDYDALNPYFEKWKDGSLILKALEEEDLYDSVSLAESIKVRHFLRLFVIWHLLKPFLKTPQLSQKGKIPISKNQICMGEIKVFLTSLHTLLFLFIAFLGSLGAASLPPLFDKIKPQPSPITIVQHPKSSPFAHFLGNNPLLLENKKEWKGFKVFFLYQGRCTSKTLPLFQDALEKMLKQENPQGKMVFVKTFPEKGKKDFPVLFCFGAMKIPEGLPREGKIKIKDSLFTDYLQKTFVFRSIEGLQIASKINTELSYNLSTTFYLQDFDTNHFETVLFVVKGDLGNVADGDKEKKIRQMVTASWKGPRLSLLEKLKKKENILPTKKNLLVYSLKEFVTASYDEASPLPYRVQIQIPRANFSSKVKTCTFIYAMKTVGKIHLKVEYIEFLPGKGKEEYKRIRPSETFSWEVKK
ncbi:MAG: hypothetical protein D6785_16605 [Planctomycetota bacterium]|nr:MAG: hypothetical protein D6785_16605 [Planctomycetota bacterium]